MAINTNLQFLRGLQADLKRVETNSAVKDGAFYLTTDTNRLYVGQGTSLVELNKSVTTVQNLSQLPDKAIVEEGQFYYVSNINVLCVYTNGEWVQINPDTKLAEVSTKAEKITNKNSVKVTHSFEQTNPENQNTGSTITASMDFEGENLKVEVDNTKTAYAAVKLTGDTYETTVTDAKNVKDSSGNITTFNKEASFSLKRNNATTGESVLDTIKIKGGDGISSIESDAANQTITIVSTVNESMSSELDDTTGGLTIATHETEGGSTQTVTFIPKFIYGKAGTPSNPTKTATFKNNANNTNVGSKTYEATLDVYTTEEVDDIADDLKKEILEGIKANDAMTYKGSLSDDEFSGIDSLPSENVANGDVYMLAISQAKQFDGVVYKPGDFFIASGEEDETTGFIPEGSINWSHIPSGNEIYTIGFDKIDGATNKSFILYDGNNTTKVKVGSVRVESGDDIIVTPGDSNDGKDVFYKIDHAPSLTEKATATVNQSSAGKSGGESKATNTSWISGLAVDDNGHVSSYTTNTVQLIDTHNNIIAEQSKITVETETVNKSVAISELLEMTDGDSISYTHFLSSANENVEINIAEDSNNNIQFNLVWGSF